MALPLPALVLFGIAGFGLIAIAAELVCLKIVLGRRVDPPPRWPSISILKPLCGLDDELEVNLEKLLEIDYPGDWEVLVGVRSEQDLAYPIAKAFAERHPERVRFALQQGEPGHNPKVNQLITLTRVSRCEVVVVSDSNVRVPKNYLREIASLLARPNVGLVANVFAGVGEERLGAILDNMTLNSFCAPNVAAGSVALRLDQIVGKSMALPKAALEQMGGWNLVQDVLAEDQRLGVALKQHGLHSVLAPTVVQNFQKTQRLRQFLERHSRWAMIRFRVLIPGVFLEPILNPFVLACIGWAFAPTNPAALFLLASVMVGMMAATQWGAVLLRGRGFKPHHLLLVPLRDWLSFFCWLRGATMRNVNWRGNRLRVLSKTRLAEPEALSRARKMQRLSR